MKKNERKIKKSLKVLIMVLILSILLPLFPIGIIKGEASGREDIPHMDYRELMEEYRDKYGEFDTPTPKFTVNIKEGESFFAELTLEEDEFPYQNSRLIPVTGTIPIGAEISAIDKSDTGSGNKIVAWDWQVVYYKEDEKGEMGEIYNEYYNRKDSSINIPAPTEKGYMIIFLSVGSNYKIFDGARYTPNEHGNWRSLLVPDSWYEGNPDYVIEGWYFTAIKFKVEEEKQADMIMRELELIDPEKGEVLESFRREVDPLDPFNPKKERLIRTSTKPQDVSELEKNKEYKVRAKYQFVSFEEGKFDISKPETMTEKQRELSTEVIPNELDVHYSYDDNVFKNGVFDESHRELSIDKSYTELKNLEEANFEWEYEVPEEVKKYIKIAGVIPDIFAEKGKDNNPKNNWALVFGRTGLRSKE